MFWQKRPTSLTHIADKAEFQGDIHVEGSFLVSGVVHGNVDVIGDMEIGQTGLVEGPEIRAQSLTIHGVVKSRIVVDGRVSISRTGRVEGDVIAKEYDVAPGAVIEGHFSSSGIADAKALPMSVYPDMAVRGDAEFVSREDYRS
ncbi:MAG: polymer-forming cytoskeletal protein [Leptolyngbyaceae bacterium]|nr:polymer-forming cytoskeletal protein [Leptolyngbyaceae bacterium]